jgi:hypothetical protein
MVHEHSLYTRFTGWLMITDLKSSVHRLNFSITVSEEYFNSSLGACLPRSSRISAIIARDVSTCTCVRFHENIAPIVN